MNTPRNTSRHPHTHPVEREQQIRHIRRYRLPGEPSGIHPVLTRQPAELLAALRLLCESLERDGDSFEAWNGLALVFAALDDRERSGRCRDVAFSLDRGVLPGVAARA